VLDPSPAVSVSHASPATNPIPAAAVPASTPRGEATFEAVHGASLLSRATVIVTGMAAGISSASASRTLLRALAGTVAARSAQVAEAQCQRVGQADAELRPLPFSRSVARRQTRAPRRHCWRSWRHQIERVQRGAKDGDGVLEGHALVLDVHWL
jgi:hypothetical protein